MAPMYVWYRRLLRNENGQDLVELTMLTPLLLLIVFGIVEFGNILDSQQALSYLTREGANIASRGAGLDEVLATTLTNGAEIQLDTRGGAIVTKIRFEDSVAEVESQITSPGYAMASRIGGPGDQVGSMSDLALGEGSSLYVVEVFYRRPMLTPVMAFFSGTIPEVMYDRAVF